MKNPAVVLSAAMAPVQELFKAARTGGVPETTLGLVHLRASQINGCGPCVESGVRTARKSGESDERMGLLVAWRETPYFTDAERAALALTEAATRLADRTDPVPDQIWEEATRHYDEAGLAAIVLMAAVTNLSNRLNVTTRQPAGQKWG
ncbi:carboxymuconolactone decarboxylase family protein [Nonomuraea sp. 3-1Str]|nr:carboxymuconolactone decarboxylase family protein [Nonomuraea sp. 3-1Str]